MSGRILEGHALDRLAEMKSGSVHCVVTSVPYWGLRAYGTEPQVWGGDLSCSHDWSEPERAPWANDVPGPNTGGKNGARNRTKLAGAFCECGAWLGELGQEPTPGLYVEHMVTVFREVMRVLRADGTLWLNIGDSYSGSGKGPGNKGLGKQDQETRQGFKNSRSVTPGLKPKDLVGIPWMLAFALRADGWYLRQDIIWAKPNPMPESVRDRCTKAHEYIFLLTRSERYFYDAEGIKEPSSGTAHARGNGVNPKAAKVPSGWNTDAGRHDTTNGRYRPKQNESFSGAVNELTADRNKRSVWTIGTEPFPEAHFATFPTALPDLCIRAGTSEHGACATCRTPYRRKVERSYANPGNRSTNGPKHIDTKHQAGGSAAYPVRLEARSQTIGWVPMCECPPSQPVPCTVLDPFGGAGTTGLVADRLGRDFILIELNPEYAAMARRRISEDAPMFTGQVVS